MPSSKSTDATAPPPGDHLAGPERHEKLTMAEFALLAEIIRKHCGIHLPPVKRMMTEARVWKRVRAVGMKSFAGYCRWIRTESGAAAELPHLMDAVTVNKTDFFREPAHFEYLTAHALPHLERDGNRSPLRVWSAACSTGEEPYTLAMVLKDYGAERHSGFYPFSILATDLSMRVLEKARQAIYPLEAFEPVPYVVRKKYLLRSKDPERRMGRVSAEVRSRVEFRRLNLMQPDYGIGEPMDVIFCRNVMIYFERPTQCEVVAHLLRHLRIGGYLFVGHSETLNNLDLPVVPVAPTVYRRAR